MRCAVALIAEELFAVSVGSPFTAVKPPAAGADHQSAPYGLWRCYARQLSSCGWILEFSRFTFHNLLHPFVFFNGYNRLVSALHLCQCHFTVDAKYKEFKDAINNNEFSDEYNLTNSDIEKLKTDEVSAMIPTLLDMLFDDGVLIDPDCDMKDIYDVFGKLYEQYLGRELVVAEKAVLKQK